MTLPRKSLMVQFILFIVFFFMGANTIGNLFLGAKYPWLTFVVLGILVIGTGIGFLYYRKDDKRMVVITEKEVNLLKYLLYGYFLVYIINMFAASFAPDFRLVIGVITGIVLMMIAGFGIIIQIRILKTR